MGRTVATIWHASFSTIAAILFFLFTLPRWWELTGFISPAVGTGLRILTGVLIGLTALPVVFTYQRTRRPEFGTPQLALTLLIGSVVAHVLAGTLVTVTAISEIWLSLDAAGPWLFGIYGAAAAIAILGIGAFYLSFLAELPPPPPKPLKPKQPKQPRKSRRKAAETDDERAADETDGDADDADDDTADTEDDEGDEGDAESDSDEDAADDVDDEADADAVAAGADTVVAEIAAGAVTEVIETAEDRPVVRQPTGKRRGRKKD